MVTTEQSVRHSSLVEVAQRMMTAARTAPKACGFDNLHIAMATGDTLSRIIEKMREIGEQDPKKAFFSRDAGNLEQSEVLVMIGTVNRIQGLNCGYCGFATCREKLADVPCVFNTHDLGLAIGSAVSIAADCRVDNRVLYSAGVAAKALGLLPECNVIMTIPLACMGKSPFFDRKAPATCSR